MSAVMEADCRRRRSRAGSMKATAGWRTPRGPRPRKCVDNKGRSRLGIHQHCPASAAFQLAIGLKSGHGVMQQVQTSRSVPGLDHR